MSKLPEWFDEELFHTQVMLLHFKRPVGAVFAHPYYNRPKSTAVDKHFWVLKIEEDEYRFAMTAEDAVSMAVLRGLEVIRRAW